MPRLSDIEVAAIILADLRPAERVGVCAAALERIDQPVLHEMLREAAHKIARHADNLERHDCLAAYRDGHCRPEGVTTAPGDLPLDPAAEWGRGPFSHPFANPGEPPFPSGAGIVAGPRASSHLRAAGSRLKHLFDRLENSLLGDVLGLFAIAAMVALLLRAGLGALP